MSFASPSIELIGSVRSENEVLFSYADWFMTDKDIQASGEVTPGGRCYEWVSESLPKKSDW